MKVKLVFGWHTPNLIGKLHNNNNNNNNNNNIAAHPGIERQVKILLTNNFKKSLLYYEFNQGSL